MRKGSVFGKSGTAVGLVITLALFAVSIFAVSSSLGQFSVVPDSIMFNWTNDYRANITITPTPGPLVIYIQNIATGIDNNYSQLGEYPKTNAPYVKYWWNESIPGCFYSQIPAIPNRNNPILAQNSTGDYINMTNISAAAVFTITNNVTCPPGRYWGYLTVSNSSNETNPQDHANITVTMDVPINTQNELSNSTGEGDFTQLSSNI